MPLTALCTTCGLSVPLPDLGGGALPACPSCGGALEEVPEAEVVEEPPPADEPAAPAEPGWGFKEVPLPPGEVPLGGSWLKVRRGLRLVEVGLRLLFGAWGLLVMVAVAVLVFRVADRTEGDRALVGVALAVGPLGFLVGCLFTIARLSCCAFDEKPGRGVKLAWISAIATLLGALSWLVPPILYPTWPIDLESRELVVGWLVSLACVLPGELAFLLFVREVGRCLDDRATQDLVKRVFPILGFFLVLVVTAVVVLPLLDNQVEQQAQQEGGEDQSPQLSRFDLVVRWAGLLLRLGGPPLAGILLGLVSIALVGRYLLAVGAACQAIDRRLPQPAVVTPPVHAEPGQSGEAGQQPQGGQEHPPRDG